MSKSVEKRRAAQTSLTGEQIDRLSGIDLRDAVLVARGWTKTFGGWDAPGFGYIHNARVSRPHTDQGAALGLLMGIQGPWLEWDAIDKTASVCTWRDKKMVTVAEGPITEAAAVMCRAYLKIVSRKGRV